MIKDLNYYNKKIKEIWPDESHIGKELIFYIKEKLDLNDLSLFVDKHKFSKEEENSINDFFEKKKNGIPLDYILQKSSFYQNDFFSKILILLAKTFNLICDRHGCKV